MKVNTLILFKTLVLSALSWSFILAPVATAQQNPADQDIGDIIDEIFKGEQFPTAPNQPDSDIGAFSGLIDNIPAEIRFDAGPNGLPLEAMLVVSAYAPPPPNVRRSSPLMLGQTRLLMTGLNAPVHVIVAAPSDLTQDLDYARLEAQILDENGTIIYELPFPAKYQGYDAPILNLLPIGDIGETPSASTKPSPQKDGLRSETVRGSVKLNGSPPKFAGSNLVVRVVEDGLAGGTSSIIAGEMRQVLDGKRAPYAFEFERVIDPARLDFPLVLEVWIEDWAGRKTHVTPAPIPYTGPDKKYRIRLDAIGPLPYNPLPRNTGLHLPTPKPATPPKTAPKPVTKPVSKPTTITRPKPKPVSKPAPKPETANISTRQQINGEARFNANKGLPKGSVLIAVLERSTQGPRPRVLASTRVFLDGLSGDVAFKLTANSVDLPDNLPQPVLRVRIESADGTLFFSNPGGTKLVKGFNAVKLRKSPNY